MTEQEVRKEFFTFRNGLLADMLRKQCALPYRVIFGLNLPQLGEIAGRVGKDESLAAALWADTDCREARLLAPMISVPSEAALTMLDEVLTVEEADVACHRLLRRCPGAVEAARTALQSERPLTRYAALRLILNLLPAHRQLAVEALATVAFNPLTDGVVRQLRQALNDEKDTL